MNKRRFSKLFIAASGLLVSGVAGIPALLAVFSPSLRRRADEIWQTVGPLDDFPQGQVTKAAVPVPRDDWARSLREKGVFVLRETADQFVVYSRNCTDLGCPITWDPGSQWFFCPCHGGIFSKDGERQAGPPKLPLYRYQSRIRGGVLEIDLNSVPPML
jgi:menaquinol-cytochrome c reductase iron-sulfur subunit